MAGSANTPGMPRETIRGSTACWCGRRVPPVQDACSVRISCAAVRSSVRHRTVGSTCYGTHCQGWRCTRGRPVTWTLLAPFWRERLPMPRDRLRLLCLLLLVLLNGLLLVRVSTLHHRLTRIQEALIRQQVQEQQTQ